MTSQADWATLSANECEMTRMALQFGKPQRFWWAALRARRGTAQPRLWVSLDLIEGPDWICSLRIENPGEPFSIESIRLLAPSPGMIYSRDAILSEQAPVRDFEELEVRTRIEKDQSLRIPFEVWSPSRGRRPRVLLSVKTSRRLLPYRCSSNRVPRRDPSGNRAEID